MACRQDISRNLQLTERAGRRTWNNPRRKTRSNFFLRLFPPLRHDTAISFPDNAKQRGYEFRRPSVLFVQRPLKNRMAASEFRLFCRRRIRIISSAALKRSGSGPSFLLPLPFRVFAAVKSAFEANSEKGGRRGNNRGHSVSTTVK